MQTKAKNARNPVNGSNNGRGNGELKSRAVKLTSKLADLAEKMQGSMDADEVHKLRTTVRRVEVVLQSVGCKRGRPKLDAQLKSLRKRAGKVRDLDVHLGMLEGLDFHQRACNELRAFLKDKRAKQAKKLEKIVRSELEDGLRKRLKGIAGKIQQDALDSSRAEEKLAAVRERYLSMTAHVPEDGSALHQLRIDCKRLRYEVEALAPEENARAANAIQAHALELVEQLKRVQDEIGVWHDWLTLHDAAEKHLHQSNSAALLSLLRTRTATHYHNARQTVAEIRSQVQGVPTRKKPPRTARTVLRKQSIAG